MSFYKKIDLIIKENNCKFATSKIISLFNYYKIIYGQQEKSLFLWQWTS